MWRRAALVPPGLRWPEPRKEANRPSGGRPQLRRLFHAVRGHLLLTRQRHCPDSLSGCLSPVWGFHSLPEQRLTPVLAIPQVRQMRRELQSAGRLPPHRLDLDWAISMSTPRPAPFSSLS